MRQPHMSQVELRLQIKLLRVSLAHLRQATPGNCANKTLIARRFCRLLLLQHTSQIASYFLLASWHSTIDPTTI